MSEPARDPVERFAAFAVMTVGALVMGLAGLCTGSLIVGSISSLAVDGVRPGAIAAIFVTDLAMLGFFGGVPMVIGVLMLRWGRRLLAPWEHLFGVDPARTAAGWVLAVLGAGVALATIGAAVTAVILTHPFSKSRSYEGSYALVGLVLAGFLLSFAAPVAPWMLVEGYRLLRGPKPPPSPPPPP